jgi:hypothetical protein
LITTGEEIFKVGSCKCPRIGKELFSTRSRKSLFMTDIEEIELNVITFVITEQIHGNIQTKVVGANPHDQV